MTKEFVFAYPIHEFFEAEIQFREYRMPNLRSEYERVFNKCINQRYRENEFSVNYLVFSDKAVSEIIHTESTDKTIDVGITFSEMLTGILPNPRHIFSQLPDIQKLRISGFHMNGCIPQLAKYAYNQSIDTLVDEDLTELFIGRFQEPQFRTDTYPSYSIKDYNKSLFVQSQQARQNKPWLIQEELTH